MYEHHCSHECYCSIYFLLGHEIKHYHCHELWFAYCDTCTLIFSSLKLENWLKKNARNAAQIKHGFAKLVLIFCLLNFLSNLYVLPWLGKIFKFMVFTSLENALDLGNYIHATSPFKTLPQVLFITPSQTNGDYSFPLDSVFSKICFPQQQKRVEDTMICFIKIKSGKINITWNIGSFIFFMICIFFKWDGFTAL